MSFHVKAYVYFAAISLQVLAGCAYGKFSGDDFAEPDSGIVVKDAGAPKDASKPIVDAAAPLDSSQDPQDVTVQTQCDPLPLATGLAACDTCLGASCCAEDEACGNDQDCMGFIECVDECDPGDGGQPDQECYGNCESEFPNGENELNALDSCMQNDCSTQCLE